MGIELCNGEWGNLGMSIQMPHNVNRYIESIKSMLSHIFLILVFMFLYIQSMKASTNERKCISSTNTCAQADLGLSYIRKNTSLDRLSSHRCGSTHIVAWADGKTDDPLSFAPPPSIFILHWLAPGFPPPTYTPTAPANPHRLPQPLIRRQKKCEEEKEWNESQQRQLLYMKPKPTQTHIHE